MISINGTLPSDAAIVASVGNESNEKGSWRLLKKLIRPEPITFF